MKERSRKDYYRHNSWWNEGDYSYEVEHFSVEHDHQQIESVGICSMDLWMSKVSQHFVRYCLSNHRSQVRRLSIYSIAIVVVVVVVVVVKVVYSIDLHISLS